jgi:hypothetical protein
MRLSQTDLGFRPDRLLTFRLQLPDQAYPPEAAPAIRGAAARTAEGAA